MGVFDTLRKKVTTAQKKVSDIQKKREIKQLDIQKKQEIKQLKKRKRDFQRGEIELQELQQKAKIEKQREKIRKSKSSGLSTSPRRRRLNVRDALGTTRRAPRAIDGKPQTSSFNPITGNSKKKEDFNPITGSPKKKKDKGTDAFGGQRPPGFF